MSAIKRVDCISVQIFIMLSFIYSIVPAVTGMGKATVGKSVLTPRVFSFANLTAAENFQHSIPSSRKTIFPSQLNEFDFDLHTSSDKGNR